MCDELEYMIEEYPNEFDGLDMNNVKSFIGWKAKTKNFGYDGEKGSTKIKIILTDNNKQKYEAICPYYTSVGGYSWNSENVKMKKLN